MSFKKLEDDELAPFLEKARMGDPAAFEPIVRRYEKPLRAWVAGHAPPGIDVDEISQRAFIAAYTRLSDFITGSNFAAWLFTIARFQLKTEMTRMRRLADYHNRFAPDLLQQSLDMDTYRSCDLWEQRLAYLQDCIQQLGAASTQFLTWRYHDQISIEEMASASGRSPGAVKKQLWALRQKLHRCIELRFAQEESES